MSCDTWERGTLVLPATAVAGLDQALRTAVTTLHDEVRAEALRIHRDLARRARSHDLYRRRLCDAADTQDTWERSDAAHTFYRTASPAAIQRRERETFVHSVARAVLDEMLYATAAAGTAPRQPTLANVTRVVPKPASRNPVFPAVGAMGDTEATIGIAGAEVTWTVSPGNDAATRAHATPLAHVFFAYLRSQVRWTPGTGGFFTGNDEYNLHDGHGRDYVTGTFGPLGTDRQTGDHLRRP